MLSILETYHGPPQMLLRGDEVPASGRQVLDAPFTPCSDIVVITLRRSGSVPSKRGGHPAL